ncbi:MAG TPA: hydrogenase maturation protease [Ktedonobacterales bacterium]
MSEPPMDARVLLIGVGNPDRGDDAAGLAVARELASQTLPHVAIHESPGDGAALLSAWQGFDVVVLVDAMPPNGHAGRIHRVDAVAQPLPADLFANSTHTFGVAQGIELARALGMLPRTLIIYGIEGREFTIGSPMSAEVRGAILQVTMAILAELRRKTSP